MKVIKKKKWPLVGLVLFCLGLVVLYHQLNYRERPLIRDHGEPALVQIYALDGSFQLDLEPGEDREALLKALQGVIIKPRGRAFGERPAYVFATYDKKGKTLDQFYFDPAILEQKDKYLWTLQGNHWEILKDYIPREKSL